MAEYSRTAVGRSWKKRMDLEHPEQLVKHNVRQLELLTHIYQRCSSLTNTTSNACKFNLAYDMVNHHLPQLILHVVLGIVDSRHSHVYSRRELVTMPAGKTVNRL